MARYDRIAALPLPERADAMPCWPVLAELAGRERETDLANRARLYFSLLRPVRRLADRKFAVSEASHDRQIAAVRAQIDGLSWIGPDRARIRAFLIAVGSRAPAGVAAATLDIAECAAARGHFHAADEFARTALVVGAMAGAGTEARALTLMARVARELGRWEEAADHGRAAVARAGSASDHSAWAGAVTELAVLWRTRGDADAAAGLLAAVRRRAAEWKEESLLADAAEALAVSALAARLPEVAVHEGWFALHRIGDVERRRRLLESIAIGLRALKLFRAADACYAALIQSAQAPSERARVQVGYALSAAEASEGATFRERHDRAMLDVAVLQPEQQTPLLIELGRGCLVVGDAGRGAAHAEKALDSTRFGSDPVMSARANELADWARIQKRGGIIAAIRTDAIPAEDTRELADEIAGGAARVIAARNC